MLFNTIIVVFNVEPLHDLGGAEHAGEPHHGAPGHPVVGDRGVDAALLERPAPAVSARHQAALGSRHWDLDHPRTKVTDCVCVKNGYTVYRRRKNIPFLFLVFFFYSSAGVYKV